MGELVTETFTPEITDDLDDFDSDADIFGGLDVTQVGDPFAVDPNTYRCTVTEAKVDKYVNNEEGKTYYNLVWVYSVDEPTSEFHGMPIRERHPLYPQYKTNGKVDWSKFSPEEKKKTKFLKLRLRQAFDFTEDQIQTMRPSMLIGMQVYVTTRTGESKDPEDTRKFTNVRTAMSKRAYEEKNGVSDNDAALNASMDL